MILTVTPIWVTLVVAAMGLIGTVGGVLLTQRSANRREVVARQIEIEREQHRWAREDAARTFEQRKDAYLNFYEANREAGRSLYEYLVKRIEGDESAEPPSGAEDAEEKLNALDTYATQGILDLAHEAQYRYRITETEAVRWKPEDGTESLDRRFDEWYHARDNLLQLVRVELGIPQDDTVRLFALRDLPHLARVAHAVRLSQENNEAR